MSAAAVPQIPPRPNRGQPSSSQDSLKAPEIPPRPPRKELDRTASPSTFPQSPLFDPPAGHNSLGRSISNDPSNLNLSARPPSRPPSRPSSVTLPSIGQEGNEYADIEYGTAEAGEAADADDGTQMRSVDGLKLHAPKPSLPQSSAKAQVKAVTRTNDQQAAAHGFGKAGTPTNDDSDLAAKSPGLRASRPPTSGSQPSANQSRRQSIVGVEDEPGHTGLGMRVPINPEMGHVQAPSPAPFAGGEGHHPHHHNKKRHHHRTKSGREVALPPGSYGLHGHGTHTHDKFDKDWYAKHPEQFVHEETQGHGHYSSTGSGRGEWALSSDDLNKIVRSTASRGAGFGTNESIMSYPDEQIGYLASDQYSARKTPTSGGSFLQKMHSNTSQVSIESPLRKSNFAPEDSAPSSQGPPSSKSEAFDNEAEAVIHVDDPTRRYNKVTGGEESINEAEGLGVYSGSAPDLGTYIDENGYSVPILASDEVAKDDGAEHLHPAVSPKQERRGSAYHVGEDHESGQLTPTSRPTSRPGSIHGVNASLSRYTSRMDDREDMHTPLEDLQEYEPLFPEEEETKKHSGSAVDRFKKRPEMLKHRFPSEDIWEDTPKSAMYETSVASPEHSSEQAATETISKTFEDPSVEAARKKDQDLAKGTFVPDAPGYLASRFAPHMREEMTARPGLQPRFPSRDIWEDTPDSMHLQTTVESPPPVEDSKSMDLSGVKPAIPPRPVKAAEGSAQPPVPPRPQKKMSGSSEMDGLSRSPVKETLMGEAKKVPVIPDRPKPQIPMRPAKKESLEALTKSLSRGSTESDSLTSPPLPKAKPVIPIRPGAAKAGLPTAFMSDLNQRLQLGPRPVVKEEEPETEVPKDPQPLSDARKGRARGPQRRAPAKSPSAAVEKAASPATFGFSTPQLLWSIGETDDLVVSGHQQQVSEKASLGGSGVRQGAEGAEHGSATATPGSDKADPIQNIEAAKKSEDLKTVSQQTTTSLGAASGPPLDRVNKNAEEQDEDLDVSRQTTASLGDSSGSPLEKVETHHEEEQKPATGETSKPDPLWMATSETSIGTGEPAEITSPDEIQVAKEVIVEAQSTESLEESLHHGSAAESKQ